MDYTHVALLASVRRLAAMPTATATGSASADLLAHANEILQSEVVPFIQELREDYFFQQKSQTVAAGTAAYRIPSRASGGKLRDVQMKNAAGEYRSLTRIQYDDLEQYEAGTNGTPESFYMRGNYVVLVPTPSGTGETLEIPYLIRPNELVSTAYGTITAIDTGTRVITYSETGTFAPTTSSTVDLIAASSGFESLTIDVVPTAADTTANTITVSAANLPADLAVGDYICTAQQSPVPQVPAEFHPLLYTKTARRMAETLGNQGRVAYLAAREGQLTDQIRRTFTPRIEGEVKVVGAGPYGLLGGGQWGW